MDDRTATTRQDAHCERVRPDSWLVGAFLVLFGVAVSAAMPQIAGAVRLAIAAKAGTADTAQRPSIRVHLVVVKAIEPKLPGGHDLAYPPTNTPLFAPSNERLSSSPLDLAARIAQRGYSARAPPSLSV